jgi:AcrR family transcriptional regulator
MAKGTKEKILDEALRQFSQKGYDGTNIRELTASLGLVKSSMYKHFGSKEDIWNALLDEMIAYYNEHFGSAENLPPVPDSLDGLVSMTMQLVNFTIHDERVVMTRKLLTIEQFRDERARKLATKHFLTGLTEMFTHIFEGMIDRKLLQSDDTKMLAFAYVAPISALIHLCDREPEKEDNTVSQIESFSRHFIKTYATPNQEG